MNLEKTENFLKDLLESLKVSEKRWCSEYVDDAEKILTEYPEMIQNLIPKIEELLEIPKIKETPVIETLEEQPKAPELEIISALYGLDETIKNVKQVIESQIVSNKVTLRIDNYSMGCDPVPYKAKQLYITYKFGTEKKSIIVHEAKNLVLP